MTAIGAVTGVLLLFASCGGEEEPPAPASLAPADVAVFAEAAVGLRGDDPGRLETFLGRILPGGRGPPTVADVANLVWDGPDLSARDFERWLGERAALLIAEPTPGDLTVSLLFEVRDSGHAGRFVRRLAGGDHHRTSHRGVDLWETRAGHGLALVDGFVAVTSSPDELRRIVDASRGRSLADTPAYERRVEPLPEAAAAYAYVHTARLVEMLVRGGRPDLAGLVPVGDRGRETVVGSLAIEGRAAILEVRTEQPPRSPSASIAELAGDAWFARSSGDLGTELVEGLELLEPKRRRDLERFMRDAGLDLEDDVAAWMGPATLYLQGGVFEELSGELRVEVKDEPAAADALLQIGRAIRRGGEVPVPDLFHDGDDNTEVTLDLGGDRLVRIEVLLGGLLAEVGAPGSARTLGEEPTVRAASRLLGRPPDFWVDAAPLADILPQLGLSDELLREVLGPVSYVAGRTVREGEGSLARYVIALDEDRSR